MLARRGGGKLIVAWECAGHRVVRVALCIELFVLSLLLISIVVVTVCCVCCSVKLPLSRVFFLFLSILLPTPVGGGAIERPCGPLLLAMAKLQHGLKLKMHNAKLALHWVKFVDSH